MTDATSHSFRRIARLDETFPGELAPLQAKLRGLVPDGENFTEDSYDELFVILAAASYYVRDAALRKASANDSGGNPALVKMLLDEGPKDKDAALVERILDRLAPYVTPKDFLGSAKTMRDNRDTAFREYHGAIERIVADLFRIVTGFKPAPLCPPSLVQWASGPNREAIHAILFA